MKDALKRSPSPFQPANKKKAKQEHDWDQDSIPFAPTKSRRSPSYEPDLLTFGNNHNRGAEFKRISDLNHSSVVNATIVQTTRELSAVGKRLIQAPKLLNDGIVFEWVLDATVKQEPVESLLAVAGVNHTALAAVLQRTKSTGERTEGNAAAMIIDLSSDHEDDIENKAAAVCLGADAAHPIIIDTDDGDRTEAHDQGQLLEKNDAVSHVSSSRSVQPVEDMVEGTSARADTFGKQPEAGPSQPRINKLNSKLYEGTAPSHGDRSHGERTQGQPAVLLGPQTPTGSVANRLPGARRSPPSIPGPSADPYPPFKGFSSESDDDGLSSDESVKSTTTSRHAAVAPDPAEGARAIDLRTELDRGNIPRRARMAHDGGTDRLLRELNSSRTNQSVGTSVQLPAKGAQPSPSPQRRGGAGPSLRRRPPRQADVSTTGRAAAKAARMEQGSDAHGSSSSDSSDSSDDSRRPTHATRRRPSALQRSSTIVRSGLFGDSTDIRRHEVNIPKAEFSRARRLLASIDREIPYATITMRGDASFIDKQRLCRVSAFSLPFYQPDKAPAALVSDACLVQDNKAVVGFMHGPCQASLISLGDQPHRNDLTHRAHNTVQEIPQLGTSRPNSGISTLSPLDGPQLRFLSGGFDMTVHLWTLRNTDDGFQARSKRLRVRQLQGVQSLAYRSVDNTLLSCGGSSIYSADISADQQPKPIKVSDGRLLQIHIHPQNPHVVILEADQIENQVLVYDTRKGGFRHPPTLQFGHRSNPNAENNTRFLKGSTLNSIFARPYNEDDKGAVRVWDYRKATAVVACFKEEHSAPVVHAVLSGSDLLAYGGTSVTIWKTRATQ